MKLPFRFVLYKALAQDKVLSDDQKDVIYDYLSRRWRFTKNGRWLNAIEDLEFEVAGCVPKATLVAAGVVVGGPITEWIYGLDWNALLAWLLEALPMIFELIQTLLLLF